MRHALHGALSTAGAEAKVSCTTTHCLPAALANRVVSDTTSVAASLCSPNFHPACTGLVFLSTERLGLQTMHMLAPTKINPVTVSTSLSHAAGGRAFDVDSSCPDQETAAPHARAGKGRCATPSLTACNPADGVFDRYWQVCVNGSTCAATGWAVDKSKVTWQCS